jgi:zinc transport system ATP-binding protein
MTEKPLLEVKNLSVYFSNLSEPVIEGVSFLLNKGEILSIIGPNGAGKTTLVKAILGLIPYQGEVYFNGQSVFKNLSFIGYVPQRFDFDKTFPITVQEFISLTAGFGKKTEFNKICRELEIEKLMNKKIGNLSGGELQRVLIAKAALNNPWLMIMDEPTAGVDIGGVKSFYDIVKHLNAEHKISVILISHEIDMVYSLANKVVCLNKKMFCSGSPRKAISKKILDKLYGKNVGLVNHTHFW